jgi:imidazolonepropionase-like amidohydrolase
MSLFVRLAGAATAGALCVPVLAAQRPPAPPTTVAITGARLVPVSGPAIEQGTIVIRNGLIAAMGPSAAVPADARVIDGAGLTIYPGLIDAAGSLGVPRPATGGGGGGGGGGAAAAPEAPSNSRYPVGQRPEVSIVDVLAPTATAWSGPHGAGITAAHTAASSGMFRGTSAVIALGQGDVAALVVRPSVGQVIAFQGIRGSFPGSLMGVFAAMRQMFLDAQRYGAEVAAASRDPRGTPRPAWDPSLEALQPALAGRIPVLFDASSEREIIRVLDFAKEFNLKPIIVGGEEAWKVADRLKAENVPVMLSINFPRRTTAASPDADPEPVRVLRNRVEAPQGPGKLAAAGVRFALTSGGASAWTEHLPNLRRAVDGGLSKDAALRAHTLGAAELLGVADRLGSLEVGKAAHLAIVRGDLFDAAARVTHVVVDGAVITLPAASAPAGGGMGGGQGAGPAARAQGLTGTWTITAAIEGNDYTVTLSLVQEGEKLTGSMQGALGVAELTHGDITAEGDFRFTAPVTLREGTEEAIFVGTLTGNAIRGGVSIVGHALGRFSGTRPASGGAAGAGRRTPTTP